MDLPGPGGAGGELKQLVVAHYFGQRASARGADVRVEKPLRGAVDEPYSAVGVEDYDAVGHSLHDEGEEAALAVQAKHEVAESDRHLVERVVEFTGLAQ